MTKKNLEKKKACSEEIIFHGDRIRVDIFLRDHLKERGYSRSLVQKLISHGKIKVNSRSVKAGYVLKSGDTISLTCDIDSILLSSESDLESQDIKFKISYQDSHIVIVNKPYGMVVHPAGTIRRNTLVNALIYRYGKRLPGNPERPGIVHRLDKDTSGLLIIAKTKKAYQKLVSMVSSYSIKRDYVAICIDLIKSNRGRIETTIGRSYGDRKKMSVFSSRPKMAYTNYTVLERFHDTVNSKYYTYVKLNLETGRTHQIRVHMSFICHPVLGDLKYGKGKRVVIIGEKSFKLNGHLLHSNRLCFAHPVTGRNITVKEDPPESFLAVLEQLRQHFKI